MTLLPLGITSGMKYLLLPKELETNTSITLYLGYHTQKKKKVCRPTSVLSVELAA